MADSQVEVRKVPAAFLKECDRFDPYLRRPVKDQQATPRREVIRLRTSDLAIKLMEYDRIVTRVPLPEAAVRRGKKSYSIHGWLSGETGNQMTAGMRFIEACCNGPVRENPVTHEKTTLEYSALTELQLEGLRMAFMIICRSEEILSDGVLNQGFEITLPGMEEDWYAEGIDEASDHVEAAHGIAAVAYWHWLEKVRRPELLRQVAEQREERDQAILAGIDSADSAVAS